jgi:hypothetical protein
MSKRTSFRNHKSFDSEKDAQSHIEKLQQEYPTYEFSVKKRTWPGKLKVRYLVRSIVSRGHK